MEGLTCNDLLRPNSVLKCTAVYGSDMHILLVELHISTMNKLKIAYTLMLKYF